MSYTFEFYREESLGDVEKLVLAGYAWSAPAFGLSRLHFSHGLHPSMLDFHEAWARTCGIVCEDGRAIACILNEGCDNGETFFVFDRKSRSEERPLLREMLRFAKKYSSVVNKSAPEKRYLHLTVPETDTILKDCAMECGFAPTQSSETIMLRRFDAPLPPAVLPEGYTIADATQTPAVYRAIVHAAAFNYSISNGRNTPAGFDALRRETNYDPELDLVVLDAARLPVAMATLWMHPSMPYCELEPLGVAWWERRRGLGTQLLNEAARRVLRKAPHCIGMTGGEQPFYDALGFKPYAVGTFYRWEENIYPSRDERTRNRASRISV